MAAAIGPPTAIGPRRAAPPIDHQAIVAPVIAAPASVGPMAHALTGRADRRTSPGRVRVALGAVDSVAVVSARMVRVSHRPVGRRAVPADSMRESLGWSKNSMPS